MDRGEEDRCRLGERQRFVLGTGTAVPNTKLCAWGEEDSERVRVKNARGRDILLPGGLLKMLL